MVTTRWHFVHKEQHYWTLVDYTRGSGSTWEDLLKLEEAKCIKYSVLVESLREHHAYAEFIPLASTYNGAIAEDTWREFMYRTGIDNAKSQDNVLHKAAQAICLGFSTMVDVRLSSLAHRHMQTTSRR